MKPASVFVIGTMHTSSRSKQRISDVFHENSFEAVLSEGVKNRGEWTGSNILKEPAIMLVPLPIYKLILKVWGKDDKITKIMARKNKTKLYRIDVTLTQMIDYFHRWYNHLIFILIWFALAFVTIFFGVTTLYAEIYSLILTFFIYFYIFVLKTKMYRDDVFRNNIHSIIDKNSYTKVLVICGKAHVQPIKKEFKAIEL